MWWIYTTAYCPTSIQSIFTYIYTVIYSPPNTSKLLCVGHWQLVVIARILMKLLQSMVRWLYIEQDNSRVKIEFFKCFSKFKVMFHWASVKGEVPTHFIDEPDIHIRALSLTGVQQYRSWWFIPNIQRNNIWFPSVTLHICLDWQSLSLCSLTD